MRVIEGKYSKGLKESNELREDSSNGSACCSVYFLEVIRKFSVTQLICSSSGMVRVIEFGVVESLMYLDFTREQ